MRASNVRQNGRIFGAFTVVLGAWLVAAPWLMNYNQLSSAMWSSVIVGVLVVIIGGARAMGDRFAKVAWINVLLAFWLLAAPFVLGFGQGAASSVGNVNPAIGNHIVVGIFLVATSWLSATLDSGERHARERRT